MFQRQTLNSTAKFAFGCNHSPGTGDDKPFRELPAKALGREPTSVGESLLRRLYNESYATLATVIKAQTEQTSEDVHRKLGPADRAAKQEEQQARLKGIAIRGPYEPGDSLVDRLVSFWENYRLRWEPWDMCVSCEHELLGNLKCDQRLVVQSFGELKLAASNSVEPCDTSSEILLRYCLMRIGLATEQSNTLAHHHHDQRLETFLACRLEVVPAGYSRTTFRQIEAADKRLFMVLAEKTRAGLRAGPNRRPFDPCFEECTSNTEVKTSLQPKPHAAKTKDDEPPLKRPMTDRPSSSPNSKGKGKSKGKAPGEQNMKAPIYLLILGCAGATLQCHRLFFSYNLKKCSSQRQNRRGEKGWQVCAVQGCYKRHPEVERPARKEV